MQPWDAHHQHDSLWQPKPHVADDWAESRLRSIAVRCRNQWQWLMRQNPARRLGIVLAALGGIISCSLLVSFLVPRTVVFDYAQQTCIVNPVILPGLLGWQHSKTFTSKPGSVFSIAGLPLYAHTTCIAATDAPQPGAAERITLRSPGIGWLHQTIRITAATPPAVSFSSLLDEPIAPDRPLVFPLSSADQVFEYRLYANDRTAPCTTRGTRLSCDTTQLQLSQSANYPLSLQRLFDGRNQTIVFSRSITTVGAMSLTDSSIRSGQTVYDKPSGVTLTFNKSIKTYDGVHLYAVQSGAPRQKIATTVTSKDASLEVKFGSELARRTSFELEVRNVTAADGGHLLKPLVLTFSTSGGPKVQSVSIGSYKIGVSDNIKLTFDTPVSSSQQLNNYIRVEVDSKPVAASISRDGRDVTVNPVADLEHCKRFTVRVTDDLQNDYGIAGGSAWAHNARTICQTTFTVGKSVQNRTITGYRFGTGNSLIVYAGNIHGDEKSANATLHSWIDYLERHYDDIPSGRTIVVIPNLNPDGYAANTRVNAHGVDLNRNFATANWKSSVTMPGGALNANGGGNNPLSEPESSAFADYIADAHPRLVLDYHAAAGVVEPNGAGDSDSLAKVYDQKSNLDYAPVSQNDAIFQYDTTGSFEDWANEKHSTPVLLVELWTKANNEFNKNQNAMWYMATL